MFHNNKMKYKIPAWKGKMFCCRICIFKQSKDYVVRHREGKFKIVRLTFIERIKEFFKP